VKLTMFETPWLVWVFGLLLPPIVAMLYSLSVLSMYSGFHEWTMEEKWPILASRLALLCAASAITYSDRYAISSHDGSNNADVSADDLKRISMLAVQSALIWVLSYYFLVETRFELVVGGPDPLTRLPKDAMKDKIVLITGANAGIGKETARQLALLGATKVILACRSPKRGQEAMGDLRQQLLPTQKISQFLVLKCDLGDFSSVREAVDFLKGRQLEDIPKIDVLILNAGVMMNDQVMTKDNLETMMQANLLGHYLLTRLLIEKGLLKPNKKSPPRILHLTSSTHQIAVLSHGSMDLDDMFCNDGKRIYSLFGQYAHSKLGNILFAKELARRYKDKIVSLAVHPGIVRTEVTRNMPSWLKFPDQVFGMLIAQMQKTAAQGAWCTVNGAAISVDAGVISTHELDNPGATTALPEDVTEELPKPIPNGSYLQNGQVRQTHPYTYMEVVRTRDGDDCSVRNLVLFLIWCHVATQDARKLWDMSAKLVGLEQE
jgi:NAD(P)-dependent dehydrogenase (short-subunit alcohol dehydrogenase family)